MSFRQITQSAVILSFAAIVGLVTAGCTRTEGGAGPNGGAPQAQIASDPPSSAAEVGPICPEHGVPEAMCTRCKPSLIGKFKAAGDWCQEHGYPESVCPICRGTGDGTGAPPDRLEVRLKRPETARLAGIETAPVRSSPGDLELVANARIVYDAARIAQVNARASGIVIEVAVDVGQWVARGARLLLIESAEVGANRSHLQAARARERIAESDYLRQQRLFEKGIAAAQEVQAAEKEWEASKAETASLASALSLIGPEAGQASRFDVVAPLAGTVLRRGATLGERVGPDRELFTIADTRTMWAEIDVPERSAGLVAPGLAATIEIDGCGGPPLHGRIESMGTEIDPVTRTAHARVPLENPDGALRANMFGRARIALNAPPQSSLRVPREAVQSVDGESFVFVRLREDLFETRRVSLGREREDGVEIANGLTGSEQVVTTGSFLLKTETLKGSIGAGCCAAEPGK
jgi:cobalt-zinc-cadmium efflux system membrane fusion protein